MIKELINLLPVQQRKQLMFAFEQNTYQIITLDDDKFLGVNVADVAHLVVEETAGAFSYGSITK